MQVQIPLPREGTETVIAARTTEQLSFGSNSITPRGDGNVETVLNLSIYIWFKFHYPARGRKLGIYLLSLFNYQLFKFHYPARGRKQYQP